MSRHPKPHGLSFMGSRVFLFTVFLGGVAFGNRLVAADLGVCATQVLTIKIDPRDHRTVYAGTDLDGLLRSTDAGASWAPLVEPRAESVSSLIFDPTDALSIYGATYGDYLFKSSDGGQTWRRKLRGLVPPPCGPFPCINAPEFHALAADPGAPSTIYAAAASLYRSLDRGEYWEKVNFAPSGELWYASAILITSPPDSRIYLAADAVSGQYAILRSSDHGTTWSATSHAPPTQVFSLIADPSDPAILYAGTTQGVFKSVDGGEHWLSSSAGLPIRQPYQFPVLQLTSDQNAPGTLYASVDFYHLFKSTDHGESWMPSQQGLEGERVNATAIDPTDSSVVYAATWSGVFRSSDGGASWRRSFDLGATPTILGTEPGGGYTTGDGSGSILIVIGRGFDAGSAVFWNGSPRRTSLFSCTRLFVQIPGEDTAEPGTAYLTVTRSDGIRSDPFPFVVESRRSLNPRPVYKLPSGKLRVVQPRR